MATDTYKTIAAPSEGIYKEKGSKFLAFAYPVHSVEEVQIYMEQLHKDYFNARHHCYAYILGYRKDSFRINDDGEPSGTGGRPIYGQLIHADLTNTLIAVVRYFGGILLGTSGLSDAYKMAAKSAIDHATIIEKTIDIRYRLCFAYEMMNDVMRTLKSYDLKPENQNYALNCTLEVCIRQSLALRFHDEIEHLRMVKIDIL